MGVDAEKIGISSLQPVSDVTIDPLVVVNSHHLDDRGSDSRVDLNGCEVRKTEELGGIVIDVSDDDIHYAPVALQAICFRIRIDFGRFDKELGKEIGVD